MTLKHNHFKVIYASASFPMQRNEKSRTLPAWDLPPSTPLAGMRSCGLISDGRLTAPGIASLKPYAVDNAIILAAGLSSRFAPISTSARRVCCVRGEVLIERQIEQLKAAGVTDIVIVVGYKKECFFYLEDKYGVKIVINNEYAVRNNNSSLMLVRELLGNTYICSSTTISRRTPSESHVWKAYYSAEYAEGRTKEWCLQIGTHDRIRGVKVGGENACT